MNTLIEWVQRLADLNPEQQGRILSSLIIIVVIWIVRVIAVRIAFRRTEDVRARYRWRKTLTYTTVIVGVILVGRVWFRGVQSIATYLGLLSAGLAIALKDMVSDLAGWIFIIWRRPFEVGDRIQIGETTGDVIDVSVFQFTLLEVGNWVHADQSTGRMIQLPNFMVFSEPMANYTKGFQYIWNEIPVLVTFESNWKKAKSILQELADKHLTEADKKAERQIRNASRQYMIFYSILTPTVYTSVDAYGVMLTIRYICEPRRRRDSEQMVWEKILEEFAKCDDIDLAYPTRRVFNNTLEGKSELKPSAVEKKSAEIPGQ